MDAPAIDCHKLTKRYRRGDQYALKDLSLQVQAGEVYGFLGPNGAGKSTTIRTLLNFIQPSAGSAAVLGLDIVRDSVAIKRHIGYLSGEFVPYHKLTGAEFLRYMADLQPLKHRAYQKELTDIFEADLHKPLETLSKANKQKFGLIQAFMHEPAVLILDEPTSGLDPLMQEAFFKMVRRAQSQGAAVFVSSHNLSEALRMCDRVGFIRGGRLVGEESIAKLQAKAAHSFIISFAETAPLKALQGIPHATVTPHDDRHVRIQLKGELAPLFTVLAKYRVVRLDPEEASLEQEFLHFYRQETA